MMLKILRTVAVTLAAILFTCWILVQTPAVQTFIAEKAAESLGGSVNGQIKFSKVHLRPFNALVIKDLVLLDSDPATDRGGERLDTIASAESIVATFSLKGLRRDSRIRFRRINVTGGTFTLTGEARGSNLKRFINSDPEKTGKSPMKFSFEADRVKMNGFRFRLKNLKKDVPPREYGIDWKDLDINVVSLKARNISFADGKVTGTVDGIAAEEKSGYVIEELSGKAEVSHGLTLISGLHLVDAWSDIRMDEYSMEYDGVKDFSDYLRKVRMTGAAVNGRLDFKSISFFAPSLRTRNVLLDIGQGDVEGTVSDLNVSRLTFSEVHSGVCGALEGRLTGLPKVKDMDLDLIADGLSFTSSGLGTFIRGFAPAARIDLSRIAAGTRLTFNGRASGILDRLKAEGSLTSDLGSLTVDASAGNLITKGKAMTFAGKLEAGNLDVGKLSGVGQLGNLTMTSTLEATLGQGRTGVRIDSLHISSLQALGYEYSDIDAAGTYSDNAFDGRIVCRDPNLNFLFQGLFTLSDKTNNGIYKFYASLGYADLHALHLDSREVSRISAQVNANYMRVSRGDIIGDLDVTDLNLESGQGRHSIGDICIKSHSNNDINRVNFTSTFADGTYIGTKPLTSLPRDVRDLTLQRELPALAGSGKSGWNGDRYELNLNITDAKDILAFFVPGLYVANGTSLKMDITGEGNLNATVKSPRLALKKNYLKNLDISLDNRDSSLNAALTSSELSAAGLKILNNRLEFSARDNGFSAGYRYDNGTEPANDGRFLLKGDLRRTRDGELAVSARTLPSVITYNGADWNISSSRIESVGKDISIGNLTATCGEQSVSLDGGYSSSRKDTLSMKLVKFDLDIADKFLGDGFGISGLATGHAIVTSPWKTDASLMMNLTSDSTKVAGQDMGTLRLASSLDDGKLHFIAKNDLDGRKTLDIHGNYFIKDKRIDATADFDRFNVGYAAPVLQSVFSEMDGPISGRIKAAGTMDGLALSSENTRFDDVLLKVGFTKVPYTVNGPFSVTGDGLTFDGISVKDRFDGTGTITGGLTFGGFKDIRMDTKIRMDRMEAIDMGENDNQSFYGHLFATGDVLIKGPFNAILLDVKARTVKEGNIHIPVDNASNDGDSNLLTFIEPAVQSVIDPYEEMMRSFDEVSGKSSDFGVKLKINANQGTEAHIEIDRSAGNVLTGRGQGQIEIEVRPKRDLFTINGDYTLTSGNFHFNAMDIAKRDFTISDGSTVRFNGDVMDSDLNINGVYSTKASVATLISDTTAVSARRLVNCGIGVTGKMREPNLSFSIDVPDLDPTTKSRVESALNTNDKVQRQFLALLISGSFLPDEQSGVVNNTNMLFSNVAEIMAGQLNNILQKLDIPLDLGLNYQSSESGTNIFDVAVSTQLFNNRVIVNGNVGNRDYRTTSSSGADVVGDLDIEIKLDKPGQLRLNLFSHSADDYTTYLDNTQRNGVGIAYQKEFNSFREFFRNLFTGRKKREQRAAESNSREVKTITVGSE